MDISGWARRINFRCTAGTPLLEILFLDFLRPGPGSASLLEELRSVGTAYQHAPEYRLLGGPMDRYGVRGLAPRRKRS